LKPIASWVARATLAATLVLSADVSVAAEEVVSSQPPAATEQSEAKCRWWKFGRCDEAKQQVEGLPADAPTEGTLITVDVSTHTAYLFQDGVLVAKSLVGTGTDKLLKKGRRFWLFRTPRGMHNVLRKIVDPIWTKPDWAFIEEGKPVPPPGSPKRQVKGHLGRYALDLGEGIMLHGTDDPNSFGRKVSHGCIRMQDEMLEQVYQAATIGTPVYIFESTPPSPESIASGGGMNDLDIAAKAK
jgi:L,D-transpeptidase ErfK/SrfK